MSDRPELLVIPPLSMHRAENGRFVVTRKFLDGVEAYAHYFPGKVTALLAVDPAPTNDLDHTEFDSREHTFGIEELPADEAGLMALLRRAGVVLGSLCFESDVRLTRICRGIGVPMVLITEYALETRRQVIAVTTGNLLKRWKRSYVAGRLEGQFKEAVKIAAGIQCNGTPTYDDYHLLNPRTLLFFDTRIRKVMVADAERIQTRIGQMLAGGPLRLAFSGRLISMKGADHLPEVARELKARGVPFTMDICGGGELEEMIKTRCADYGLADAMRMRGNLDFVTELVPTITHACDLFVQCHPQGDPSCTYLETMSCGTPIVGYDNAAFRGVARMAKAGFGTPLGDPVALAAEIARLHQNREELATAARVSLAFAEEHTFERTMQSRVNHLLACMRQATPGAGEGRQAAMV